MSFNKKFTEIVLGIKEISHITDVYSYGLIKQSGILKTRISSKKNANHKNIPSATNLVYFFNSDDYKNQYLKSTSFMFEDLLFEIILVNNKNFNNNRISIDEDWVFSYFFENNNKFIFNKKTIFYKLKIIAEDYSINKNLHYGLLLLLKQLKKYNFSIIIHKGSNEYKRLIKFFYSNQCLNIRKIIFCGFTDGPPSITIKDDISLDNLEVHQKIHFVLQNEQSNGFPYGFDE